VNDVLVRARDLIGRPVVTLGGERVGELKDVVLGLGRGVLVGFTLRNPGFLGGPKRETLLWGSVHAVGPDAVMVPGTDAFASPEDLAAGGGHRTVDLPLVTDDGQTLGQIVDVVLETGTRAQVVGFEIEPAPSLPSNGHRLLLPIDAMAAASEEAVVVPASVRHFVRDDLTGFGAAVAGFRAMSEES
jgi:sporulation protein YlmC with PRC-barrel domain